MNRKFLPLLLLAVVALFQSCRGPKGDPGPNGGDVLGITFDITKVNFTAANNWGFVLNFDQEDIEVLPSDAVLVYVHWDTIDGLKSYQPLPQTAFGNNGLIVTYSFNRTDKDMEIFVDSNVDRSRLATDWTNDFEFRVVVVPADFLQGRANAEVDFNNYESVVKAFNIDESKIKKISAR
ncbi:hypothetical protein SAMN04487996_105303 [Dyadobacter soli]|uniref:Uncharacterized protein n=1 Tax=Dyadobacter soli TaxID=659014 RepID=A0A1G7DPI9_9BACT|nr:hypothetical protein [Dyadobacter soli]SDE53427.1 hypothetical protein SAMN04487996_105303 [Dyadobacter soli]